MHSVSQKCRPKHQVLVLKCYPRFQKGVQEVKPNSSELSYLLYYASTRRSKLPKVGAFLEKRAARDVWRGKIGNVQVTLQILAALIEKLPRELPLYAKCVLTILETVLRSHEISMVEETLPTFEAFCHHQDMAVLAADRDYLSQYRDIVRFYASLASPDQKPHSRTPPSAPILVRWRKVGLQAVKSVVSSEALTTDGAKQLSIVMPVVLQNLYCIGNVPLTPLQEEASNSEKHEQELSRRRRMSIATVQTVDTVEGGRPAFVSGSTADADKIAEAEVRVLALRCLEKVFATSGNRGQIRIATSQILQYIVDNCPPWRESTEGEGTWATNLIEVIAKWAPVQDRFIILLSIMEALVHTPVVEDKLESHLILAAMMDWLLASPMNLIGLSVMDILIGLLEHIYSVLQLGGSLSKLPSQPRSNISANDNLQNEKEVTEASAGQNPDHAVAESPTDINLQQDLVELLQRCIGDIATHVYYPDQVSDMIRTIITRLKPVASSEGATEASSEAINNTTSNPPTHDSTKKNGFFTFPAAQIAALRAVKNILVVANLRTPLAVSGTDSRNKVSIQVWQGTQWLLSEPDREVRRDYIDALLSWLQLETTKDDLRVPSEPEKTTKLPANRDVSTASTTLARRIMSTSRRESNAAAIACSRFLQGLHLAIYDLATESALVESDILLAHLLLVNLVENLGVNAARYGLPMILRLQEDFIINQQSNSALARLHIGSLVHGYLWALTEKFDLERTRVGSDIVNEISKRKRCGVWLDKVQLPPRPINYIGSATSPSGGQEVDTLPQPDKSAYTPFGAFNGLVDLIEHTYNSTYSSPPASPPHSPGRAFSAPSFGQGSSSQTSREDKLPANVRDQMLSPWSKDACLAALEAEKANSSINGSKAGTLGTRYNITVNGDKNGNTGLNDADASPHHRAHNQDRPISAFAVTGGAEGYQNARRQSNPEGLRAPPTASSRDSTVKVRDLRRVLSVINNSSQVRLSSPLRGRPRVSHRSTLSSSSTESMVSDTFSGSDGTNTERAGSSRPQSSQRDGSGTPKASVAHQQTDTDSTIHAEDFATDRDRKHPQGIPPVPPLPSALTIPGGFPDSTASSSVRSFSYSPVRSEHNSPSPTQGRQSRSMNGQNNTVSVPRQSRSLTRQKSRSTPHNGKPVPRQLSLSAGERRGYGYSGGAALAIGHDGETPPLSPMSPLSPLQPRDTSAATVEYRGDRRQSSGAGHVDLDRLLKGFATDGNNVQADNDGSPDTLSPKYTSELKAGKAKLNEVTPPAGRKREAVRFSSLGRNGPAGGGIGRPPD